MASRNGSGFALERADGGIEVYPEATKTGYSLSKWVDSDGNELSIHSIEDEKTFYASWIDDIPPVMTIEVTNDFAREQTISISAVDEGSGVAGYYIGTDNPGETAVTYGDIVNMTVSEAGTYYCSSIDIDGNVATEQIVFFAFTFDANGGSTVCEKVIVQSGKEVELVEPSKPGYSASWIEDSTGEVVTTAIADGDKSFTANYIDDIAPTFSVSITDALASSQSFTLSATDEGSGVLGFYFGVSDPAQNEVIYTDITNGVIDASGTYYFAVSDNAGNVVVESYTFYVFTLNANGNMDVLLAGGIEFTLPDVSKTGYSYVWVEDSTGSVVTSSAVDADKSFTAQYTANQYTVTFDANGGVFEDGTYSCEKTVTYDDVYGELPIPTRDGYTFLGWYTEATGGEEILRETKVITAGNTVLYAQWYTPPVGYIWNNTRYTGHVEQSWYNNTGRDITFNYIIKNSIYSEDYVHLPSGSLIYISSGRTITNGSCVVSLSGGTLSWITQTGTFTCPAGKYVVFFGQNNSDTLITVWE